MNKFFIENMMMLRVIYAILFFLLSLAVKLKVYRKSELRLAKYLWLLAGYSLAQGFNELLDILLRFKGDQFSAQMIYSVQTAQLLLKVSSYFFIFWLSIRLLSDAHARYPFLKVIGVVLVACWSVLAITFLWHRPGYWSLAMVENLSRYFIAFPGFALAGIGSLKQIKEVAAFNIPSLTTSLKGLAATFWGAAFIVGLIASEPVFWPATVLNRQTFMEFTGIPAIFLRSLMLVSLTYFVIRIVEIFEVERELRLQEALRQQVLFDERDRIGRELHDGIIQSIYGVGLKLDQALILYGKRPEDAKKQLGFAKEDLNGVITDIRDYIQGLQPSEYGCASLLEGVSQLIYDFRSKSVMQIDLVVAGQQSNEFNIIQINNVLQVLRELLINAVKHSRAFKVTVSLQFTPQDVQIRVSDDGIGFNAPQLAPVKSSSEKQGLKNVFYRIGMLQGIVVIHTAPGHGTQLEITIPYKKLNYASNVFIEDPNYFLS